MISLKKCLCVLGFGLGLGFSMSSWAVQPDCAMCAAWEEDCAAGNAQNCERYEYFDCFVRLTYCPR